MRLNIMWKGATKELSIRMCFYGYRQRFPEEPISCRMERSGFTAPDMPYPASFSADTAGISTAESSGITEAANLQSGAA